MIATRLQFTVKHTVSEANGIADGTLQAALLYGDTPTHMKTVLAFAEKPKTK